MERFVIVMPVDTSAYLLPCDDGGHLQAGDAAEAGGRAH